MVHTVKGFDIVNEAEVDVFLELSCFFNDPTDVGNLIYGSSPFSKPSLNIWKFIAHVLLKYYLLHYWVKILWILHIPFLEWVIIGTILSGKVRNYSKPYVCPCEYFFSFFQMVLSMASEVSSIACADNYSAEASKESCRYLKFFLYTDLSSSSLHCKL